MSVPAAQAGGLEARAARYPGAAGRRELVRVDQLAGDRGVDGHCDVVDGHARMGLGIRLEL